MKMKNETALTDTAFAAELGLTTTELAALTAAPAPLPSAPEAAPVAVYATLEALLSA